MRAEALRRLEAHGDRSRLAADRAFDELDEDAGPHALASVGIAQALAGLIHANAEDERDTYERREARDRAFAAELRRLDSTEAASVSPAFLRARRAMVIEALEDGHDGPPTEADYEGRGR
jgi:hypothetical protein